MVNILVTGGAGYVGSHACKALKAAGYTPITFDNLSSGWRDAVQFGPFFFGDINSPSCLESAFQQYQPQAICHFAARSNISESQHQPAQYWLTNVMGSLNLLQAAQLNGCKNIIFSSTCAVYGDQPREPLSEDAPLNPSNAYAASKLAAEHLLQNFQHIMPLKYLIFRYFNVAGADPTGRLGECHMPETHLIPCLLQAAEAGKDIQVFGTNYQTPDGTCLRDFIHVSDIARAYVCGVQWLLHGKASQIFNLGSGRGYSVLQVISAVSKLTGQKIKITAAPRRPGDCAWLQADIRRVAHSLGWSAKQSSLDVIIRDAQRWQQGGGYAQ